MNRVLLKSFFTIAFVIAGVMPGLIANGKLDDEKLIISKFAGFPRGEGGTMAVFKRENSAWVASHRGFADSAMFRRETHDIGTLDCLGNTLDSMFVQSQFFAMDTFVRNGYLTHEEALQYMKNSVSLTDQPITFFNILSSEKPPVDMSALAQGDVGHMKIVYRGPRMNEEGYVRASLYSVAGQRMKYGEKTVAGEMEFLDLPWTKDPEFAEAAKHLFSREKYPYVWEFGRAASTDPHAFPQLMASAGENTLRELMHFGVPQADQVKKGFISAHFLTQENTEKFEKLFPGRIFLRSSKDRYNTIFMVPLEEYLEKFPPRRFQMGARIMHEISEGPRSTAKIYEFLESLKLAQYQPLDFQYKGINQHSPIMMNSYAAGRFSVPIEMIGARSGIKPSEMEALFRRGKEFLDANVGSSDIAWPGKLFDPASVQALHQGLEEHALQISNLDPKLATTDFDYTPSVLASIFDHFTRQFIRGGDIPPALIAEFKQNKLNFVLTTHDPKVAEVIRQWKPAKEKIVSTANDLGTQTTFEEMRIQSKGKIIRPSTSLYTFKFDVDQVLAIRNYVNMKNRMDPKLIPNLRPGYHWWLQGASEP